MRSLLQFLPDVSNHIKRPTFAWREDSYWSVVRGMPNGQFAGSKMRMFDHVWWGNAKRVCTTGVVQSNQVRQLALYMSSIPSLQDVPLYVRVAPDKGRVNFADEVNSGNLIWAKHLHANTTIDVIEEAGEDAERRIEGWLREESRKADTVVLPRGMACREGLTATTQMGRDLAREVETLSGRVTVVVVSGSGSTHMGLQRAAPPNFNVIGLSTKKSAEKQISDLSARDPVFREYARVDDRFSVRGGGATEHSNAMADIWSKIMGIDIDRQYCGRICEWLDYHSSTPGNKELECDHVVLVITGLDVPAHPASTS